MAKRSYRGGRIGEEIKRIISEMLLRELKDPGFSGLISVTGVKAAEDGSFATVYVAMLGSDSGVEASEDEKDEVLRAFERAKGLIRKEIGARMQLRRTPELQFRFDMSGEYGRHIEKLIDSLGVSGGGSDADADGAETVGAPLVTVRELSDVIARADVVHIFPHENMDGDTLGSSVALCLALRGMGKVCAVIVGEKIPDNIRFIENHCVTRIDRTGIGADDPLGDAPDLAIMMDVGAAARLSVPETLFAQAAAGACVDHHVSAKAVCDYNLIDTRAAAAAELVYALIEALGVALDARIAEALYVGVVTDTGRFQYESTTEKTHLIAAELLRAGVRPNKVFAEIYQSFRVEKLYLENAVMGTMTTVAGGRGVIAHMTRAMRAETGALDEETEGIAEKLRAIRDVEVSVFLRETDDGKTKGSLRSKSRCDVAALAGRFGGGGHIRAAGFTTTRSLPEIRNAIEEALREIL